ncbi:hypothetical protein FB384_003451 [Prauserella sediminis]|uniref:Uncharacterized protein n=1 Tax=Prauserella sediminis TaxID=577680 RepID=A0A839XPE1_9PSEU|nr:hypothetical protein [Prauserella sediminis]MBB3664547.1 hypothetical protein [Prauserella sediminis]
MKILIDEDACVVAGQWGMRAFLAPSRRAPPHVLRSVRTDAVNRSMRRNGYVS